MPHPEYDKPHHIPEHLLVGNESPESRRRQRQLFGERATEQFVLLTEIISAYDDEREYMRSRIIGQDHAIEAILTALDRSTTRPLSDMRPKASLAFLGPTGTGKTELAKVLAEVLGGSESNFIRIDCAGFSQRHEVSSIKGAPPGYVGRDQDSLLSRKRVEKPNTVVLFDEIEKSVEPLHDLLLHIMDNGTLVLHNGEIVNFRDVIIITTSNIGAKEMVKESHGSRTGFSSDKSTEINKNTLETVALKSFKDFFKPEFINRLDSMVVFHPLNEEALYKVLGVKVDMLNQNFVDEHGAYITLSRATQDFLVKAAFQEREFGVRPLVRAIDKHVVANFGRYTAHAKIPEGSEVMMYHRDELDPEVAQHFKGTFIFAMRKDASVKRRPLEPIPHLTPLFAEASSRALARVNTSDTEDDTIE